MVQYMNWPVLDKKDVPAWMRTHLVPSIVSEKEKRVTKEGDDAGLLIGIKGSKKTYLFEMDTSDYSVWEFEYTAIVVAVSLPLVVYSLPRKKRVARKKD